MDDLVSRSKVIKAYIDWTMDCLRNNGKITEPFTAPIRRLPSVQPEQRWIPCSERLPEKDGHYLITTKYKEGLYVTTDDFFCYGWDDWGEDVIAWMPLPEPYEGSEKG